MKYFTVKATGKTYPVREDLQSWAFFWNAEQRCWIREGVDEHDVGFFQMKVNNPTCCGLKIPWTGVILELIPEPDSVVTDEMLAEFDKEMKNGT